MLGGRYQFPVACRGALFSSPLLLLWGWAWLRRGRRYGGGEVDRRRCAVAAAVAAAS